MLLDGFEGGDGGLWVVGAVEVPGVEAGEVLEGAEDFVAADWIGGRAIGLVLLWYLKVRICML